MNFSEFIETLKSKLTLPLPGHEAHLKLMHKERLISKVVPNVDTKSSAVLIVFYESESHVKIPLILRPAYEGTHGGQMALPGGKVENHDENLTRTALREAQEEIGIKALDVKILGQLTEVFIPVSNFMVMPIIGYLNYKPEFFPDAKEVDKIFEINFKDFMNIQNRGMKDIKVGNRDMTVPGFEVQDQWIWGATALIISELLDILEK